MYGSNFWIATFKPLAVSSFPSDAAAIPFPSDDTTPPVIKMYFVITYLPYILFGALTPKIPSTFSKVYFVAIISFNLFFLISSSSFNTLQLL